jgi:hypothetical protein
MNRYQEGIEMVNVQLNWIYVIQCIRENQLSREKEVNIHSRRVKVDIVTNN